MRRNISVFVFFRGLNEFEMLVSIKVQSGITVLKSWGLVECDQKDSIQTIFNKLSKGVINSGDNFVLEDKYMSYEISASIGHGMLAERQHLPLSSTLESLVEFGKYLVFELKSSFQDESDTEQKTNPFEVMLKASKQMVWPTEKDRNSLNKKLKLHNAVLDYLKHKQIGWSFATLPLGNNFVSTLVDCLWTLDPHRTKFISRSCPIPFTLFQGYNAPAKHGHVAKPLDADTLKTMEYRIYNILEEV